MCAVCVRERAKDRHLLAVKEELSRQQQSQRERERKTERVRLTREEEGKRARGMASQSVGQPPLIMVPSLTHSNSSILWSTGFGSRERY